MPCDYWGVGSDVASGDNHRFQVVTVVLSAASVVVAALAIVFAITYPETRRALGLEEEGSMGTVATPVETHTSSSSSAPSKPTKKPHSTSATSSLPPSTQSEPAADPPTTSDVETSAGPPVESEIYSPEGDSGLFLKAIRCVRRTDSVQVFAEFFQSGDYDGRITYRIESDNGDVWDTSQFFSETTDRSRNLEVTGVHYRAPVRCIVDLVSEKPTYSQSIEMMSR